MEKTFLVFFLLLAFSPTGVFAHGEMMGLDQAQTGVEMMQYVEEQSLGPELHEEMETLMEKMMAGDMTQEEASRMTELMNQYPGPQAMMMNRMMGTGSSFGMMPFSWSQTGSAWPWLMVLLFLVWLAVGILAAALLWQNIKKKH